MKKYIYISVLIVILHSCSYSLSKRRYSRGFNLDFGFNNTSVSKTSKKKKNRNNLTSKNIALDKIEAKGVLKTKIKCSPLKPTIDFELRPTFTSKNKNISKNYFSSTKESISKDSAEIFEEAIAKANAYSKKASLWNYSRLLLLIGTIISFGVGVSAAISSNPSRILEFLPLILLLFFFISMIGYYVNTFKTFKNLNNAILMGDTKNDSHKTALKKSIKKLSITTYISVGFILLVSTLILLPLANMALFVYFLPILLSLPILIALFKLKQKFKLKYGK